MDLWRTTPQQRETAAREHAASIGQAVSRVDRLTTGLWMSYRDTAGRSWTLTDSEVPSLLRRAEGR